MTTKVNLIHGKKNAHSSEEFSGEWVFLYNGILYMSLATFSMEVAIWGMKFPLFIWQVSALSALLFTFSVQLRGAVRGLWRLLFSTKHDLGRENAILMGKCACTAGLFCNMLDRLDADPVFPSLGRAEEPAFFVDFTVKCVFHFDQKKPLGWTYAVIAILRRAGAVRRLASNAFSRRLDSTRHRSISSTGSTCGKSSLAQKGTPSRFARAQ